MALDIYRSAADVIDGACQKKGSLKQLCYSSKYKKKKKLFALVFQTIKYKKLLEKVEEDVQHIWDAVQSEVHRSLKIVLLYETVLGLGVHAESEFHDILHEHHSLIVGVFQDVSNKHPNLVDTVKKSKLALPRYVRVNTLKISTAQAIEIALADGFEMAKSTKIQDLSSSEFFVDQDIPDVLVFAPDTDLHNHRLYKEGKILFQDKASCLPAFILNPPPHSSIIDACAAPGNKSSHAASIIGDTGTVYSFDLDKERFNVMNKLLRNVGATCVKTVLKDFLKVKHDGTPYSDVEYVIVDPSCSGSGIVSRMDDLVDDENVSDVEQKSRLKGLSGFQTAVLSHALSFPNVKRVVYSTCSVHKEENEDVVEKACKRFASTFSLVKILPKWRNRGIGEWEGADKCIRAVPEIDYTNGFFVAMFESKSKPTPLIQKREDIFKVERNESTLDTKSKKRVKSNKRKEDLKKEECLSPFSNLSKPKKRKKGSRVKRPVTL